MSAPTPTWRRPSRQLVERAPSARSTFDVAVAVTARLGTAVTLAALLVLTGTVLGHVAALPAPSGPAAGR